MEDISVCKYRCASDMHCTGFTFYGDEDDTSSASVCALTGTSSKAVAMDVFADGPFAQLPPAKVERENTTRTAPVVGTPPRIENSPEYASTQNYAIMLGLDKLTDGFYQSLKADDSGDYTRQGFMHTCGLTDTDEVVIPTAAPSRVYTVRVWKVRIPRSSAASF